MVLATVVAACIVGFWVWAFVRGPGVPHRDELATIEERERYVDYAADPIQFRGEPSIDQASPELASAITFMLGAELRCAEMLRDFSDLPLAQSVVSLDERAALLDQGTDLLDGTLADLAALPQPTEINGAEGVTAWLADFAVYSADRRAYSDRLRTGDDGPFELSASLTNGERVTTLLTNFAEVNSMYSCLPPEDL